jgi:6-phosphogluconolactonase
MALLTVARDEQELAQRVAERFVELASGAGRDGGRPRVVLTGGRTPKRLYELLASPRWRATVPWERVDVYWSDERHVPPDHAESNFGMAREALLRHLPIPDVQVHRIRAELPAEEAARAYEEELPAAFDVMLLGMGDDGHVASIFADSPLLTERHRRAAAVWVPHLHAHRITLTPPALLSAARILMMVAGTSKAPAVRAALADATPVDRCPARLLAPAADRVEWLIDRAASTGLSAPPT